MIFVVQMSIGIDISYFVPFKLGAELCGENGLPVCPNSTRIIGRAQVLKSIRKNFLQQFIDLEQGQQERLIIAQEKFDTAKVNQMYSQSFLEGSTFYHLIK